MLGIPFIVGLYSCGYISRWSNVQYFTICIVRDMNNDWNLSPLQLVMYPSCSMKNWTHIFYKNIVYKNIKAQNILNLKMI